MVWVAVAALAIGFNIGSAQDVFQYTPMELPLEEGVNIEQVKDIGNEAIKEVVSKFVTARAGEGLKTFEVLPFAEDIDRGYFTKRLPGQFAEQGKKVGYIPYAKKDEAVFNQILKEIRYGEEGGDIMDPQTVQKFGRLSGVEVLIKPDLSLTTIDGVTTLRITLSGYVVETGRQLPFGQEVKKMITPPAPPVNYWKWVIPILIALVVIWVIAKFVNTLKRPR